MKVPFCQETSVESLARLLAEYGSGSDITLVLANRGIRHDSGESTKSRRLYWIFLYIQWHDKCANRILDFIRSFLAPARFVQRSADFEAHRTELKTVLALSGLKYSADEQFRNCAVVKTLPEVERRVNAIQAKFRRRRIHPEVLKYCKAELMQDNYFHAIFEASKGLAQRIRETSGVDGDGIGLVEKVSSIGHPLLAFNTLQTETERTEHKGFAFLLKGCLIAIESPLAHESKVMWDGEDDAAHYSTLISLLHKKLDECVPVRTATMQ